MSDAQDTIDELKAELHDEKCKRIEAQNEMGKQSVIANDNLAELRASERFREHARQRCIKLEKIIGILLDRIS